jgi:divalent metal cation (Fe/Co/Zn/Cd) transporter
MSSLVDRAPQLERGILVEWLSTAWMVLEAAAALVAGVLTHSVALVAFGADSVVELVAEAAVLSRL